MLILCTCVKLSRAKTIQLVITITKILALCSSQKWGIPKYQIQITKIKILKSKINNSNTAICSAQYDIKLNNLITAICLAQYDLKPKVNNSDLFSTIQYKAQ